MLEFQTGMRSARKMKNSTEAPTSQGHDLRRGVHDGSLCRDGPPLDGVPRRHVHDYKLPSLAHAYVLVALKGACAELDRF